MTHSEFLAAVSAVIGLPAAAGGWDIQTTHGKLIIVPDDSGGLKLTFLDLRGWEALKALGVDPASGCWNIGTRYFKSPAAVMQELARRLAVVGWSPPTPGLQRWRLDAGSGSGGDVWLDSEKDPEGEWVRWEDVKGLPGLPVPPVVQEALQTAFDAMTGVTVRTVAEGRILQAAVREVAVALSSLKPKG